MSVRVTILLQVSQIIIQGPLSRCGTCRSHLECNFIFINSGYFAELSKVHYDVLLSISDYI